MFSILKTGFLDYWCLLWSVNPGVWVSNTCDHILINRFCTDDLLITDHLLTVLCVLIRLVIDDGTGEAHVWFSGVLVRSLLQLAENQWEGLQRALRVRGQVRVYARGRSLVSRSSCQQMFLSPDILPHLSLSHQVCDDDTEDTVVHFLLCVCSKDAVCRPLSLTCRKYTDQSLEGNKHNETKN